MLKLILFLVEVEAEMKTTLTFCSVNKTVRYNHDKFTC